MSEPNSHTTNEHNNEVSSPTQVRHWAKSAAGQRGLGTQRTNGADRVSSNGVDRVCCCPDSKRFLPGLRGSGRCDHLAPTMITWRPSPSPTTTTTTTTTATNHDHDHDY